MKISIRNSLLYFSLLTFIIPRFWNIIYIGAIAIDIYKIYILSLFCFFLFSIKKLTFNKFEFVILLIFIFDFISCFYSYDFFRSFFYLINDFLGGFIFFYYGLKSPFFIENKFSIKIIQSAILLCFSFGLIEFFTNYNFFETIARDFFGSKTFGEGGTSSFGKFLGRPINLWGGTSIDLSQSLFGLFFLQLLIYFRNKTNLNFILLTLCLITIFIAQSRACYIALILFYIIYKLLSNRISYKLLYISLLFIGFFLFNYFVPDNLISNTYRELSGITRYDSSLTARILALISIFTEVNINFFGNGYGVMSKLYFNDIKFNIIGYIIDFINFDVFYFAQRTIESGLISLLIYLYFYYILLLEILSIKNVFLKNILTSFLICSFLLLNSTGLIYAFFIHFFIYGNIIVLINSNNLKSE